MSKKNLYKIFDTWQEQGHYFAYRIKATSCKQN